MVSVSYSIVEVRAVVIKSFNSLIADVSMPTPWSSDYFTIRADIVSVGCVK